MQALKLCEGKSFKVKYERGQAGGGRVWKKIPVPRIEEFKCNKMNQVSLEVFKVRVMQCEMWSRAGAHTWFCPFI